MIVFIQNSGEACDDFDENINETAEGTVSIYILNMCRKAAVNMLV